MKKYLFVLMCYLLTIISTGCRNNDDSDNQIMVNFQLQKEDGVECYTFHEGENIIFKIEIVNNGEEEAILPAPVLILGNDIFHVYSSKGEDFGNPYDVLILPEVGLTSISPKSKVSFLCPWFNNPNLGLIWDPRYLEYEIEKLRPLPNGDYYSKFTIKLDDNKIITCKKTFKIE